MKPLRWLLIPAGVFLLVAGVAGGYRLFLPDIAAQRSVTVYVSTDQEIADPILQSFASRTGIDVKPVFDLEANKTAGLALRLLAERGRPAADVFWASEPARMARLAKEGVLAPYASPAAQDLPDWARQEVWTAFSSRARVLLVNTDLVPEGRRPASLQDLLRPEWKGRIGIADPRFGTTSSQVAAWGRGRALAFAKGLRENGARVCAGNAMVREMVERGELAMGLTDTDDAWAAVDRGMPVAIVYPDQEGEGTLVIPNAVALVKGAPHPEEARLLMDFLLSREVEGRLAEKPMRQAPLRASVPAPEGAGPVKAMPVDWAALGASVDADAQAFYEALKP